MKPIRLMSGFLTVGFWTLMSRILGFVRDILIAGFLGAGPQRQPGGAAALLEGLAQPVGFLP